MIFLWLCVCALVNLGDGKCEVNHRLVRIGTCQLGVYQSRCQLFCYNTVGFPKIGLFGTSIEEIAQEHSSVSKLVQENFVNTPNVEKVILIYCNINTVESNAFSGLHKLNYLSLSGNPLTSKALTNAVCSLSTYTATLVQLDRLFLKDHTSFNDSMLECLKTRNISELNLSLNMLNRSQIQSIFCAAKGFIERFRFRSITLTNEIELDKDFFECFSGEPLSLDLSHNSLSEVSFESFTYLENLTELKLSDCELVRFVQNASIFKKLHSLKHLDISRNNFRDFNIFSQAPKDIFPKLESLDLSGNRFLEITKFSKGIFPTLKKLAINGNKFPFGTMPRSFVYNLVSLQTLNFARNMLTVITKNSFCSNSLKVLKITGITIATHSIKKDIFTTMPNLTNLTFDQLQPYLNVTSEYKKFLDKSINLWFRNLKALRCLSLRNMNVVSLERGVFEGTDGLQRLDLSQNRITTICQGAISLLTQLTWLDMTYNDFRSINRTSLPLVNHKFNIET